MTHSDKPKKFDIAIIGAGVLGISLAYHLRDSGLSIVVIEKETTVCRHASARNAGMIRSLYRNEQLSEWAIGGWDNIPPNLKELHFKRTGSVVLGRICPEHHIGNFIQGSTKCKSKDVPYVYSPDDGLLDSESYVHGLWNLARKSTNISLISNSPVKSLRKDSPGNWNIACGSNTEIIAQVCVNAAGAWLNEFLEDDLKSPASAFARHLFVAKNWNGESAMQEMPSHGFFWDEREAWYMREWGPTSLLLSACDEEAADPDNYNPNSLVLEELSEKMLATVPHLASRLLIDQSWHCFRTYHSDTLPLWGEDPRASGLFWLCAFGGYGMSTSFAASKDLAELILVGSTNVDSSVFIKRSVSQGQIFSNRVQDSRVA